MNRQKLIVLGVYSSFMFDLHTHTVFSDGELIPSELIRRAEVIGLLGVAMTDHVDCTNIEHILRCQRIVEIYQDHFDVRLVFGVEITHVPPLQIPVLARHAKEMGADIVVVHGETPAEPVAPGTNRAALECEYVDILAHPGFIVPEEAEMARDSGIVLELTAREGHNMTNGHVAKVASEAGALMVVNTDAHAPEDLITEEIAIQVARGAGLSEREAAIVVRDNPLKLL